MPRMRILSATEQQLFDLPPQFDSVQRKQFFDFPKALRTMANDFHNPSSRIGFFVMGGYFKATKCFFAPSDFHQRDIETIARQLALPEDSFDLKNYTKTTRLRHEHLILEFYGFKRFDTATEKFISEEMARTQLIPKLILWRCVDLLVRNKVQIPGYHRLAELILSALNQHQRELVALVKGVLTPDMKTLIDSLFVQAETGSNQTTKTTRYKLTLLKNLSQYTRLGKKIAPKMSNIGDLIPQVIVTVPHTGKILCICSRKGSEMPSLPHFRRVLSLALSRQLIG
jgi:Domain of unknown function (DUF4158)